VFILKAVKVLCFDTLLQVFILKGVAGRGEGKAAGLSGCCPDEAEDSDRFEAQVNLSHRDCSDRVAGASLPKRYGIKTIRKVKAKVALVRFWQGR
jgi:hypothetical protein